MDDFTKMGCEHSPKSWMKCIECADKAVREWKEGRTTLIVDKAKAEAKLISKMNKLLKGDK